MITKKELERSIEQQDIANANSFGIINEQIRDLATVDGGIIEALDKCVARISKLEDELADIKVQMHNEGVLRSMQQDAITKLEETYKQTLDTHKVILDSLATIKQHIVVNEGDIIEALDKCTTRISKLEKKIK